MVAPLYVFKKTHELRQFWRCLDLAPRPREQLLFGTGFGLGRRLCDTAARVQSTTGRPAAIKGKVKAQDVSYHLWTVTPFVSLQHGSAEDHPTASPDERAPVFIPSISSWLLEDTRFFYLKVNLDTRQIRIVASELDLERGVSRLFKCCAGDERLDVEADPFVFFCCAFSKILETWSYEHFPIWPFIQNKERFCLSLNEDTGREQEEEIKLAARELRQLLPPLSRQLECFEGACRTLTELIDEHRSARKLPDIPDEVFIRVEKNLQTLLSWASSAKNKLGSRFTMIDTCLSTLSVVTSLKNDRAVSESTDHMARLAEYTREENISMGSIARATKLDSEAMKTIAIITMLYLPATFVATLFSMGIFNFDFDDGKRGELGVSTYWWLYLAVAVPLTGATFYAFSTAVKLHKHASDKESEEAKAGP